MLPSDKPMFCQETNRCCRQDVTDADIATFVASDQLLIADCCRYCCLRPMMTTYGSKQPTDAASRLRPMLATDAAERPTDAAAATK